MANIVYPKYRGALLAQSANVSLTGNVKVSLIDTASYTYNASHEFYTSLAGIIATSGNVANKSYTNGAFKFDPVTFTGVAAGSVIDAIVVWIDTGTGGTSRLVVYLDSFTGVGSTTNGQDFTWTPNASGVFVL